MELYFPKAYEEINWDRGYVFLDKELQRIRPRNAVGRRFVDKLAQVYLKAGSEVWTLAHVEAQGEPEDAFPRRMYEYNYRLDDKHRRPIASFAILTDTRRRWRPSRYQHEVLGCEISMRFQVVKLIDFRNQREVREKSDNPFAVLTLAFLDTIATKRNVKGRLAAKLWAVRRLRNLGFGREDREELFRLIDWIMELPPRLQLQFDDELARDEEVGMPFVSSIERRGIEKGWQEGRQEAVADMVIEVLEARFDAVPDALAEKVRRTEDPDRLRALHRRAIAVATLEEFAAELPD